MYRSSILHILFFLFFWFFGITQEFKNISSDLIESITYVTTDYGGGLSFVDINNDNFDDLSIATHGGETLKFFLSNGSEFSLLDPFISDTSNIKQLLWVDFNNDGLLDIYLSSSKKNKLFKNKGNYKFEDVTQSAGLNFQNQETYSSTWFDYDKDGFLDLCVSYRNNTRTGGIHLFHNTGNEMFEKTTNSSGIGSKGKSVLAMSIIDYDNDGWDDIFLAQDYELGNQLLENNGNGTFTDVSIICGVDFKMNSMTATIADINNDGWQDIYITNTTEGNKLLINNKDKTFIEQSSLYNLDIRSVTFGAVFFDADNDMDLDVHIGGLRSNYTFENPGLNSAFIRRNIKWGLEKDKQFNNGVAIGDYNNDGYIDFSKNSVTRTDFIDSKNSVWQNNFSGNSFLKIKLKGTISNSHGIGAKLALYAGEKVQYRHIACGESFSSQHSYTQHFGLSQFSEADSLVVIWPSQNRSVLKNIPSNQIITIEEPLAGCMDSTACNYNPKATINNGFCTYISNYYDCLGCINDVDNDGVCDELEIKGCTDKNSCNYNPKATDEDGSCTYLPIFDINGPQIAEQLQEVEYKYDGNSNSTFQWEAENGSIILGQGSNIVIIVWHEKDSGVISVVEQSDSECKGSQVALEIKLTPANLSHYTKDIVLTPNPVTENLKVNNLILDEEYEYNIYNVEGKKMLTGSVSFDNDFINVKNLNSGLYFIRVLGNNQVFVNQFIKC